MRELRRVHETTKSNLEASYAGYKSRANVKHHRINFKVGYLVWTVLTKDRFPPHLYNKLASHKISPFEIIEDMNSNAYRLRLRLPPSMHTSGVFNVKHLSPYAPEDMIPSDSRANRLVEGKDDEDMIAI